MASYLGQMPIMALRSEALQNELAGLIMKMIKRIIISFNTLILASCVFASSYHSCTSIWANAEMCGVLEAKNPFFLPGETMRFVLSLKGVDGEIPPDRYFIDWERRGDDGVVKRGRLPLPLATNAFPIVTSMSKPGFVCIEANVVTADGKKVPKNHRWEKRVFFQGGAAVEPWKLKSTVNPKDFGEFWSEVRKKLDEAPMDVIDMRRCSSGSNVDIYAVKVACPGPHPMTGYMTVPKQDGDDGKYPAVVRFAGAGTTPQAMPTNGPSNRILLSVNTQGYDLGREQAYYVDFFKTVCLHGCPYGRCREQNKNRYTTFFYGMAMRSIRAVDYVSALTKCNGVVYVEGGSQGGFQASIAAAHAKKTPERLRISIPWGLDWSGVTVGRMPSTYRPDYEAELNYYDPCLHAMYVKCPVEISNVGLGDYVSPPSSITVFYNNLSVPRQIRYTQGATHGWWPKGMQSCVFTNALTAASVGQR